MAHYFYLSTKKDYLFFKNTVERMIEGKQFIYKELIKRCLNIKKKFIEKDEFERKERIFLNYGHTFGHAIESFGKYDGTIIHGEAVSIGICLAFKLSHKMGFCSPIETTRVISLLKNLKLPTSFMDLSISITTSKMLEKFKYDKKNKNNQLTFILNEGIGKSFKP